MMPQLYHTTGGRGGNHPPHQGAVHACKGAGGRVRPRPCTCSLLHEHCTTGGAGLILIQAGVIKRR